MSDKSTEQGIREMAERVRVEHNLSEVEARTIEGLATITLIILKILRITGSGGHHGQRFARKLYGMKEILDQHFPERDGTPDPTCLGECLLPNALCRQDGETCVHAPHTRAAIVTMAMMRYHPEFDLGVDEDEAPDPNEGMVSAEEA